MQYHSSGNEGGNQPIYHGQGSSADSSDHRTLRYFQACAKALDGFLAQKESIPMLLAAVDEHVPVFRRTISYPGLVTEQHISGNPDDVARPDLHKKAQRIMADLVDQDRDRLLDQVKKLEGESRTCIGIEQVARATAEGRVHDLFVAADKTVLGSIDANGKVEPGDGSNGEAAVDLLNEAAAEVLLQGGNAYVMPAEAMPSSTQTLAILRY